MESVNIFNDPPQSNKVLQLDKQKQPTILKTGRIQSSLSAPKWKLIAKENSKPNSGNIETVKPQSCFQSSLKKSINKPNNNTTIKPSALGSHHHSSKNSIENSNLIAENDNNPNIMKRYPFKKKKSIISTTTQSPSTVEFLERSKTEHSTQVEDIFAIQKGVSSSITIATAVPENNTPVSQELYSMTLERKSHQQHGTKMSFYRERYLKNIKAQNKVEPICPVSKATDCWVSSSSREMTEPTKPARVCTRRSQEHDEEEDKTNNRGVLEWFVEPFFIEEKKNANTETKNSIPKAAAVKLRTNCQPAGRNDDGDDAHRRKPFIIINNNLQKDISPSGFGFPTFIREPEDYGKNLTMMNYSNARAKNKSKKISGGLIISSPAQQQKRNYSPTADDYDSFKDTDYYNSFEQVPDLFAQNHIQSLQQPGGEDQESRSYKLHSNKNISNNNNSDDLTPSSSCFFVIGNPPCRFKEISPPPHQNNTTINILKEEGTHLIAAHHQQNEELLSFLGTTPIASHHHHNYHGNDDDHNKPRQWSTPTKRPCSPKWDDEDDEVYYSNMVSLHHSPQLFPTMTTRSNTKCPSIVVDTTALAVKKKGGTTHFDEPPNSQPESTPSIMSQKVASECLMDEDIESSFRAATLLHVSPMFSSNADEVAELLWNDDYTDDNNFPVDDETTAAGDQTSLSQRYSCDNSPGGLFARFDETSLFSKHNNNNKMPFSFEDTPPTRRCLRTDLVSGGAKDDIDYQLPLYSRSFNRNEAEPTDNIDGYCCSYYYSHETQISTLKNTSTKASATTMGDDLFANNCFVDSARDGSEHRSFSSENSTISSMTSSESSDVVNYHHAMFANTEPNDGGHHDDEFDKEDHHITKNFLETDIFPNNSIIVRESTTTTTTTMLSPQQPNSSLLMGDDGSSKEARVDIIENEGDINEECNLTCDSYIQFIDQNQERPIIGFQPRPIQNILQELHPATIQQQQQQQQQLAEKSNNTLKSPASLTKAVLLRKCFSYIDFCKIISNSSGTSLIIPRKQNRSLFVGLFLIGSCASMMNKHFRVKSLLLLTTSPNNNGEQVANGEK